MSLAHKLSEWKRTRFVLSIIMITVALLLVIIGAPQMEQNVRLATYVGSAVVIVVCCYEIAHSAYDELRGGGADAVVTCMLATAPARSVDVARLVAEVPVDTAASIGGAAEERAADVDLRDGELARVVTQALTSGTPLAAALLQAAARVLAVSQARSAISDCLEQYAAQRATMQALLVLTQTGLDVAHAAVERAGAAPGEVRGEQALVGRLAAEGTTGDGSFVLDEIERDAARLRTLYVALVAIATSPGCDVDAHTVRARLRENAGAFARADPLLAAGGDDVRSPDDSAIEEALRFAKGMPGTAARAVAAQAEALTPEVLQRLEQAVAAPAPEAGGPPAAGEAPEAGGPPAAGRAPAAGETPAAGEAPVATRPASMLAPILLRGPDEAAHCQKLLQRHFPDLAREASPRCQQALALLHALGPHYRPQRAETCCEAAVFVAVACTRPDATTGISEAQLQTMVSEITQRLPRPACHVDLTEALGALRAQYAEHWPLPFPAAVLDAAVNRYYDSQPVDARTIHGLLWATGVGYILVDKAAQYAGDAGAFNRDAADGVEGLRIDRRPPGTPSPDTPLGILSAPAAPAALYACGAEAGANGEAACRALSTLWYQRQEQSGWYLLHGAEYIYSAVQAMVSNLLASSAAAAVAGPALQKAIADTCEQASVALLAAAAQMEAAYQAPAAGRSAEEVRAERLDFGCAYYLVHGLRRFALCLWELLYGAQLCGTRPPGDVPYTRDAIKLEAAFDEVLERIVPAHARPTVTPQEAAAHLQAQPGAAARFAFGEPSALADLAAVVPAGAGTPTPLAVLTSCVDQGLTAQLAPYEAAADRLANVADDAEGVQQAMGALVDALELTGVRDLLDRGGDAGFESRLLQQLLERSGFAAAATGAAARLCTEKPETAGLAVRARLGAYSGSVIAFLEAATIALWTALRHGVDGDTAGVAAQRVAALAPFVAPLARWARAQTGADASRLRDRAAAMRTAYRHAVLRTVRLGAA